MADILDEFMQRNEYITIDASKVNLLAMFVEQLCDTPPEAFGTMLAVMERLDTQYRPEELKGVHLADIVRKVIDSRVDLDDIKLSS